MAYGNGNIFKNNTDGTLTRLNFAGPNFSGAFTEDIIADGFVYGDLAGVGPDNAFYINVAQFEFPNGAFGGGYALMRIEVVGGGGFGDDAGVPEPGTLALLGLGMLGVAGLRRKS